MSGFSPEWLDLREAADAAARDERLLQDAADTVSNHHDPLIVDLGSGTGSMRRALAPRLSGLAPRWKLVDSDADLLDEAVRRAQADGTAVEPVLGDLSRMLPLPFADAALVTASALFDLVSETFLDRCVATLSAARAPLYTCLIYDGTTAWQPASPLDEAVLAAFNRHQRTDKGFGPALGPTAATVLLEKLDRAGFRTTSAESPWHLGPKDGALMEALIRGIATAAIEEGTLAAEALDEWLDFRLANLGEGTCTVGHVDVFATPA